MRAEISLLSLLIQWSLEMHRALYITRAMLWKYFANALSFCSLKMGLIAQNLICIRQDEGMPRHADHMSRVSLYVSQKVKQNRFLSIHKGSLLKLCMVSRSIQPMQLYLSAALRFWRGKGNCNIYLVKALYYVSLCYGVFLILAQCLFKKSVKWMKWTQMNMDMQSFAQANKHWHLFLLLCA